jgi:predicted O-linked N-acetylglucosamine transferase (SPINDLY family)
MQSLATIPGNRLECSRKILSAKLQQANQLFESGNLEDAKRTYSEVLKAAPHSSELLHMVGLIEIELGNYQSAEAYLYKAIAADPERQDFYTNLGQFCYARNRFDDALNAYKKALAIGPGSPEIFCLIGDVYKKEGIYERAAGWYQKAIQRAPKLSAAYNNLGSCYHSLNEFDKALKCYRQVLRMDGNNVTALNNAGILYLKLGMLDKAIGCYKSALVEAPDCAEIHNSLASAYIKKRQFEAAENTLQTALSLDPDNYMIKMNFGTCLRNQGKHDESKKWFAKVLQQKPDHQRAFMHSLISLPVIYAGQDEIDTYRLEYSKGLDVLINDWETKKKDNPKVHLAGVTAWTNFYLPYQGRNDLSLQKKFGRYLCSVMKANYPQTSVAERLPNLKKGEKIRVGYISENMISHTVGKLFIGWIENSDPSVFEIYCYHTNSRTDDVTGRFRKACHKFYHNFSDRDRIAAQIMADNIHILTFLDIGMNAKTQLLAARRLAPVQCVAWGHPITTGMHTVDYFLSSDLMEPADGQDHYSETLIKLPDLSICYSGPRLPENPGKRDGFGLKGDDFVYLSTQSLFKYLPEDDSIYADIALSVPNSKFVFLRHESDNVTEIFKQRLKRAFDRQKLDAEKYCIFQPRLPYEAFLSLNMVSDVLLDPPAWSGGMTSLEGISCGIPVVTLPGKFMRSRHTYAMLKLMGIGETIAADKKDYIQIAVRLGTDRKFHAACREAAKKYVNRLYRGEIAIKALESFYKSLFPAG